MNRISTTLATAAVAFTTIVSSASAQSLSIAVDRRGLSAFAAAPASDHATIAVPGGSVGYNELLATN